MSANSKIRERLKFQRRWRCNDIDSSADDSESSLGAEAALSECKIVSTLVPVGNDSAEKERKGRSKNDNSAHNEKKRGSHSQPEVSQKKSKSKGAAMDDLNDYMNSLLEELRVSSNNLLSWMRKEIKKLMDEEKASESETEEGKVILQNQNNPEDNAWGQYHNILGNNVQFQHPNNLEECGQGMHQSKFEGIVQMQGFTNLEDSDRVQSSNNSIEKVQLQRQKTIQSSPAAQISNGGSLNSFGNNKTSADSNSYTPAFGDQVNYSQAVVLVKSSDMLDQNVQVQQQKSNVLAISAQTCNSRSPVKNAANSNNHYQEPDNQVDYSQAIESIASAESDDGQRSEFYVEPKFSFDPFNKAASSTCLTLPSVLMNPHIANNKLDTSSLSYIQPRIAHNQTGIISERLNPIMGSTSQPGYLQGMQPQERRRHYGQIGSRDLCMFNHKNTTSSTVGSRFTVPQQTLNGGFSLPNPFELENQHRENNYNMKINGGSISYSLPEPYIANNFHSHPNYRAEGRLMTYQDSSRFPKGNAHSSNSPKKKGSLDLDASPKGHK